MFPCVIIPYPTCGSDMMFSLGLEFHPFHVLVIAKFNMIWFPVMSFNHIKDIFGIDILW